MNINLEDYILVKPTNIEIINTIKEDFYDIEVEDDNSFFIFNDNDKLLNHNCDGFHITGLVLNFLETFFPSLLSKDFVYQLVTPILRVSKNGKHKYFYKLSDFEKWKETNTDKNLTYKYFKGLGSLTSSERDLIFNQLDKFLIKFHYTDPTHETIDMVFNKDRAEDRKMWLNKYISPNPIQKFIEKTTYENFVNRELIEFSMEDNIRSIPNIMDGFKPSQRKILYTLFKLNSNEEINVNSLGGYVKAYSNYLHGPQSLEGCITGLAQNFVNSNNLNLLEPIGQFGTRLQGGSDAASSRYIYTKLRDISKLIFIKDDEKLLNYNFDDDNKPIEPIFYTPIIPLVLINGSEGIGTGWSTNVCKFSVYDIIEYLENKLNNKKKNITLNPYYEKFKGSITYIPEQNYYLSKGIITRINATTLNISELPIGIWNDKYYELLDKLMDNKIIKTYYKNCTDKDVNIEIKMTQESLNNLSDDDLINVFQLTSRINITNMYLFDINSKIKKYNTQYDIIDEFFECRLGFYQKRKDFLLGKLTDRIGRLNNIHIFIKSVIDKKLVINNQKIEVIISNLEKLQLEKLEGNYNYLMNIPVYKFSMDELNKLENEITGLNKEIIELVNTGIDKLWKNDLNELKKGLKKK